jgi:signal peptidase I
MANMFALILVIATLVTGLLWCLDKFIFAPKRRERQAAAQAATGDALDKKTLKKVGPKPGWLETGASVFRCWRLCWWCVHLFMSRSRSRQVR